MRYVLLFLAFSLSFRAYSQTTYSGRVLDLHSREALPFVNIALKGKNTGTSTNIDGAFTISASTKDSLIFSYVGYADTALAVVSTSTVRLRPVTQTLREVEVYAGENPAWEIIRRVIKNRDRNDPLNLKSFQYKAYHKLYATVEGVYDTTKLETVAANFLSAQYIFMNETMSQRKYVRPSLDKETVLANRMSGIKDPFFGILGTNFQPFSFYSEQIKLLDKQYLNPISSGTFNRYDFNLDDTIYSDVDTTFIISFESKRGKTFEALKGVLYVSSRHYAIANVLAEPDDETSLVKIKTQQKYSLINDHWFPKELNSELIFKEQKVSEQPLKYVHRSYVSEVVINPAIDTKEFGSLNLQFDHEANRRSESYWNSLRTNPLSQKEKNTFAFYDSLPSKKLAVLNSSMRLFESIATGKLRAGSVYVPFEYLIRRNAYENLGIGFGVQTAEALSNRIVADGYLRYGLQDKGLKYGCSLLFKKSTFSTSYLKVSYSNDIIEAGNSNFFKAPAAIASSQSIRNWLAMRMDSVTRVKAQVNFKPMRSAEASLFFQHSKHNPTYDYSFAVESLGPIHHYSLSESGLQFKFVPGEKYTQIGKSKSATDFKYPLINLVVSKALSNFLEADFSFAKIEAKIDYKFFTKGVGETSLQIASGYLYGLAPYGSMFNGRGTNNGKFDINSFVVPGYFQTMGVYEFVSDRYATVFFTHDFGRIVSTGSKYFRPEILVMQNVGVGFLNNPQQHHGIDLREMNKGFFESGVLVNNLIRFNYFNFGFIGIGAGAFYRYGPYRFDDTNKNLVKKISVTFAL